MRANHANEYTINRESMERFSSMLATLPPDAQCFLMDLFANSYETVSRLGPQRLIEIRRQLHHHPGQTSVEAAFDQLFALIIHSPASSGAEQDHARRLRSRQRLWQLLLGDEGEPPLLSEEVAAWLGKTTQVLNRQAKAGRYVSVSMQRANRYPIWQFARDGSVPSKALVTLFTLFGERRRWPWIAFLRTPQPDLKGLTPIEWLKEGRELAPAQRLAKKRLGLIEAQ